MRTTTRTIPPRPSDALTGSQFQAEVAYYQQPERDQRVLYEILCGNIPGRLRGLAEVSTTASIGGTPRTLTYRVMPDYLAVGSDDDALRMPMSPLTAQVIGDTFASSSPRRGWSTRSTPAPVQLWPQAYDPSVYPSPP